MSLTYTVVFLFATCFNHIWALIRQTFVTGETTALYTLSSVLLGTSLFVGNRKTTVNVNDILKY
jgi:hypothetical protein